MPRDKSRDLFTRVGRGCISRFMAVLLARLFFYSFDLFAFLISVSGLFYTGIFALSRFSSISLLMNIKSTERSCFPSLMARSVP